MGGQARAGLTFNFAASGRASKGLQPSAAQLFKAQQDFHGEA